MQSCVRYVDLGGDSVAFILIVVWLYVAVVCKKYFLFLLLVMPVAIIKIMFISYTDIVGMRRRKFLLPKIWKGGYHLVRLDSRVNIKSLSRKSRRSCTCYGAEEQETAHKETAEHAKCEFCYSNMQKKKKKLKGQSWPLGFPFLSVQLFGLQSAPAAGIPDEP